VVKPRIQSGVQSGLAGLTLMVSGKLRREVIDHAIDAHGGRWAL
jgi:hypothetical protein